jgi:uncharacterized protein YhaN
MRFSKLALERYGRFEGCELDFREAQPDLHIIYGPNEAGKTTSLAAVSDLLFGFQTRSPYNFLFDYSLLRVGAVLQEGGRMLACHRRKTGGATLIDGNDRPIDEGGLLGMLRRQTRDTFRLSFSLDQDALRRGGRAMVEAKNDLGQALFAAGSGLTGISEELKRIEDEADGIWGKRARASRIYTQAERQLAASVRAIRDAALKPKTWTDAKRMLESAEDKLSELEGKRDALQLESRKAERIRRVAGRVQLRSDLLQQIEVAVGIAEISPHLEAAAEAAMEDAEAATRARSAAEKLLAEFEERALHHVSDPAVIEVETAIEQLIFDSGAIAKASKDLVRLEEEKSTADAELQRLRSKACIEVGTTLASEMVARLRELGRAHAEDAVALRQIATSEEELEDRRKPLAEHLERVADDVELASLIDAVDAAHRLGSDADDRCSKSRRQANAAAVVVEKSLARVKPWEGGAEELRSLPTMGSAELDAAKQLWANQRSVVEDEEDKARRFDEEKAKFQLQIASLSKGAAISQEELAESRRARNDSWAPLRAHILSGSPLDDASDATLTFERTMTSADDLADQRFTLADASARLATLGLALAERELEAVQARGRSQLAKDRLSKLEGEWETRLSSLGLPRLEPVQLETWIKGREDTLNAAEERARLEAEADQLEGRRTSAVKALYAALGESLPAGNLEIAGVLGRAERLRSDRQRRNEQLRLDRQKLAQIEEDFIVLSRRRTALKGKAELRETEWAKLLEGSGVVLDIATADVRLALIDEVRQAERNLEMLSRRIEGIYRDAERFHGNLKDVMGRLRMDAAGSDLDMLQALRARLDNGQNSKRILDEIKMGKAKRQTEIDEASAKCDVAMKVIAPLLEQTGASDDIGLSVAIEKSRTLRQIRKELTDIEALIVRDGDGLPLDDLVEMALGSDVDGLASRTDTIARHLEELNAQISEAARAHGDASRAFVDIDNSSETAVHAASDAEQARAEMSVQAEAYILKRAQALTLRWMIERYRERHQDPLLLRASELFSTLTLGRYSSLRVEFDEVTPRLLGITNDGRKAVEVGAMSEGTTDQLFLALRLAAVEQSVAAGVQLPFLADDLFVNFDNQRAAAGFRVLAELAQKTQVLFFTHHAHLTGIARNVIGDDRYSECALT